MEAIGLAASLVTLVGTITAAIKVTTTLCHNIRDTPQELAVLNIKLQILEAELEALSFLTTVELDAVLPIALRFSLLSTLNLTHAALKDILNACEKGGKKTGLRARLKWSLLDESIVTKQMDTLKHIESSLTLILQSILTNGQVKTLKELECIKAQRLMPPTQYLVSSSHRAHQGKKLQRRQQLRSTRFLGAFSSGEFLKALGIDGSLIRVAGDTSTVYNIKIRSRLPFSSLFGDHILALDLSLRSTTLCRSLSVQDNSTFSIQNIVSDDAAVMIACANGDMQRVVELFSEGDARPDDVTVSNSTPLRFAIESGNLELVRLLLDNGPSVNRTFGMHQTSPLAWAIQKRQYDIVCLLLKYGANLEHIGAVSWTPLFYCWPYLGPTQISMSTYLTAMAENDDIDLDIFDKWGWAVIHRAAAFGTADDVEKLISLGASVDTSALPLRWNAIYHAVFYGNLETFSVLANCRHETPIIHTTDARGWTLLHVAASAGHGFIVRRLLDIGADPLARSIPFMSHMPETLFNKSCTPGEVAAAQSTERRECFLRILAETTLDGDMKMLSRVSTVEDVFYDAEEVLVLKAQ